MVNPKGHVSRAARGNPVRGQRANSRNRGSSAEKSKDGWLTPEEVLYLLSQINKGVHPDNVDFSKMPRTNES